MKATSDGAWANERPIDYSLPLLIIQLCLILLFSRAFAFVLKPLRQPRVIAEIIVSARLSEPKLTYLQFRRQCHYRSYDV